MATNQSGILLDTQTLLRHLQSKATQSEEKLRSHYPVAVSLFEKLGVRPGELRTHAARLLAGSAVAGSILLASPALTVLPGKMAAKHIAVQSDDLRRTLIQRLSAILPQGVRPLTTEQEEHISAVIDEVFGIRSKATLEGNKLNQSYGYIGAEQHLPRYPGDTPEAHAAFLRSGITPGKGAWGYFASSRDTLTNDLVEKERWYVAVQTLYLPDWQERLSYLRDWYKYRKVLVINPENGEAVIADIADAGPASWTGKHFGGSPEVMAQLKLNVGKQKGAVVVLFVDDPDNSLPLGPVPYPNRQGEIALNN